MKKPLVSIIITTKDEEKNIKNCLESIRKQTHKNIEIIVVDNKSTDKTKEISKEYTKDVYDKGPERSVQRNYGVEKSKGDYILILDADMILTEKVVGECFEEIEKSKAGGVIIPEESFGEGFWAQCKKLERSFYIGVEWMEAARFYSRRTFDEVGGFDVEMISGEDWDLSQRVKNKYGLSRINNKILHNEGKLSFIDTIKKKYYYSKKISVYLEKNHGTIEKNTQTSVLGRYALYFSDNKKLFRNPAYGFGMLFMKSCEFVAGASGYIIK